ncbi:recombinase RecX [Iodidimonas gelatinilytica]|uniref:Regulatory protein RecX n=1 Tax=Iodidimonas gelatinilytica TaxID=1236966 RepID=A0A5A7MRS8_9PROT|nr:RecX family transcriptional regulator [Iodidimonas gelatinilytica]GEQ98446.1 recombinase RecX [Iodidimonas gelatinilytica]
MTKRPYEKSAAKPMTPDRLERAAYHYLERFATSAGNLRRVLEQKIRRRNASFAPPSAEQEQWIDTLIEKLLRLQLLDDRAYAEAMARSQHLRGKPKRSIQHWLKARAVSEADIDAALNALADDIGPMTDPDHLAAMRFARKRRLGPWKRDMKDRAPETPDRRAMHARQNKEIAAFARAGFSYDIARKILAADTEEELEALFGDGDAPIIDAVDFPADPDDGGLS